MCIIVMFVPHKSIHDACSFLPFLFLEDRFLTLQERLSLEVCCINLSELLKEFAAEGEYKLFLHFFPISLNKDTSVCLEVHYLYVAYQVTQERVVVIV